MSGVCGKGKRHKMSTTNDNMHVEQTLSAPIQVVEAAPTKKRGRPPKDKVPQDRTHSSQAVPSQMTLSVAGNSQSATHIVFQTPCSTAEATTSFKRVPNEFAVAGSSRTISPSPPSKHQNGDQSDSESMPSQSECEDHDSQSSSESDIVNGVIPEANQVSIIHQQLAVKESQEVELYVRHGETFIPLQVPNDITLNDSGRLLFTSPI